jgi:hypothetical protein
MCETGSAYWDARTGCFVGCLPPTTAAVAVRSPDGYLVTAASLRAAHEGVITRTKALVDRAVDNG